MMGSGTDQIKVEKKLTLSLDCKSPNDWQTKQTSVGVCMQSGKIANRDGWHALCSMQSVSGRKDFGRQRGGRGRTNMFMTIDEFHAGVVNNQ